MNICTTAFTCYKITEPWLKSTLGAITTSTTKYTDWKLFLKELQYTQNLLKYYQKTIQNIENIQNDNNISICALQHAKNLVTDYELMIKEWDLDTWFKGGAAKFSPEWYRSELLMFNSHLKLAMLAIQTDLVIVLNQSERLSQMLEKIIQQKKTPERELKIRKIRRNIERLSRCEVAA